jgi:hypothetical protein
LGIPLQTFSEHFSARLSSRHVMNKTLPLSSKW